MKKLAAESHWYSPLSNSVDEPFFTFLKETKKQSQHISEELQFNQAANYAGPDGNAINGEFHWFARFLYTLLLDAHSLGHEDVSFGSIRKTLEEPDPVNLQTMRERFHKLMHTIGLDDPAPWDALILFFWTIKAIGEYDWKMLSFRGKGVDAKEYLEPIEDLYFISALCPPDFRLSLPSSLGTYSDILESMEAKLKKLNTWLLPLICCICEDAHRIPKVISLETGSFAHLAKEIEREFEEELTEYRETQDEIRVQQLITNLFGQEPLEEFPVYNKTTHKAMKAGSFSGLTLTHLFSILLTYQSHLHEHTVMPCLRGLQVHGSFTSPTVKKQFIQNSDGLERSVERIALFAEELSSPSQSSLLKSLQLLTIPMLDTAQKSMVRTSIKEANSRAFELAQETLQSFQVMHDQLKLCIYDLESYKPQVLDAITSLTCHQPDLVESLKPCFRILGLMNEILHVYVPNPVAGDR